MLFTKVYYKTGFISGWMKPPPMIIYYNVLFLICESHVN